VTEEQAERLIAAMESNELLLRSIFDQMQTLIRIHQLGIVRSGRAG
jgi:hypothetical protein